MSLKLFGKLILGSKEKYSTDVSFENKDDKLLISQGNKDLVVLSSPEPFAENISVLKNLEDDKKEYIKNLVGKIQYNKLEGGYFEIVQSNTNSIYVPVNLQKELKPYANDQHRIEIAEAYANKDDVSFMSGKLIYVIKYYIIVID